MVYYEEYLRLLKMGWLVKIYKDLRKDFPMFIYIYKRVKKESLNKHDITVLVKNYRQFKEMEHKVEQTSISSKDVDVYSYMH